MERDVLCNNILKKMYGRSIHFFRKKYSLLEPYNALKDFEYLNKNLIVGIGGDIEILTSKNSLILGGPCIDHCGGDIYKLTYQAIVDCWLPLLTSYYFDLPCLITIEDKEQVISDTLNKRNWYNIASILSNFIKKLSDEIGIKDKVKVIKTSDRNISHLLHLHTKKLDRLNLDLCNLYKINYFGSNKFFQNDNIEYSYKRNLSLHLPNVACKIYECGFNNLIIAENLQQIRSMVYTKKINSLLKLNGKISYISFITTPSLSGKIRMSRSDENDQLLISDKKKLIIKKFKKAYSFSTEYWKKIIPNFIKTNNDNVDSIATSLIKSIKHINLKNLRK